MYYHEYLNENGRIYNELSYNSDLFDDNDLAEYYELKKREYGLKKELSHLKELTEKYEK